MFVLVPTGAPALASSGTLMSLRTTPHLHACQPQPERAGAPSESDIRVPSRVLSAAKQGESGAPERVGSPVGAQDGAHRSHPWVRRGTRTNTVPPATAVLLAKAGRKLSPSCRSCPAAHSHEREPNAPRSAPHPASNQCRGPPRRCRCAPPARARPNRQCR